METDDHTVPKCPEPIDSQSVFAVFRYELGVPNDTSVVVTGTFPTAELAAREATFLNACLKDTNIRFDWHETRHFPSGIART